ncbi:polyketide synthase [Streptomyces purpurascens]
MPPVPGPRCSSSTPAGGPVTVYRTLAEPAGTTGRCTGWSGSRQARTGREARRYAEAINTAHPDGPAVPGGWSFGGFVAQETARHLTAAGGRCRSCSSTPHAPSPGRDWTRADRVRAHFEGFARHVAGTYGVRLELPTTTWWP